jgi:hypothetical protein
MSGGFDVAEALDGGISDRERAWAFIRSLAGAWGVPLTDDDGTPRGELVQAEAVLGCSLPTALLEFHTLAGARTDLVANQDPLLPPNQMFVHDECGGVLVFRSENQGCAFWGVRLTDLAQDDPPVLVKARHGWVPFVDRVSLACVELVLSEALFGGGGRLYNACELPGALLGAVPDHFQWVQLPDYPLWTGPENFPCVGSLPPASCCAKTAWACTVGFTSGAGHAPIWMRSARSFLDGGPWDTPSHLAPSRRLSDLLRTLLRRLQQMRPQASVTRAACRSRRLPQRTARRLTWCRSEKVCSTT